MRLRTLKSYPTGITTMPAGRIIYENPPRGQRLIELGLAVEEPRDPPTARPTAPKKRARRKASRRRA